MYNLLIVQESLRATLATCWLVDGWWSAGRESGAQIHHHAQVTTIVISPDRTDNLYCNYSCEYPWTLATSFFFLTVSLLKLTARHMSVWAVTRLKIRTSSFHDKIVTQEKVFGTFDKKISLKSKIIKKCSDTSMELQLTDLLGNYDREVIRLIIGNI